MIAPWIRSILPVGSGNTEGAPNIKMGDYFFPEQASTVAPTVDWLYYFILWISVFFFVLIVALLVWFMIKYRRRSEDEIGSPHGHNTPLEVTWTVIPLLLVIAIFYYSMVGYLEMRVMPRDALEIQVTAQKWAWSFTYPGGHVDSELHVPVDEPVRLVMSSEDVLHSFFVPAFRVKQDVVPGRYTKLWFEATKVGPQKLVCTEYCGTKHSEMYADVMVHGPGEFGKWLERASNIHARMDPVEAGKYLVEKRGCLQCHSLTGTKGIGPTFKGLFGRQEKFADGSTGVADENYLRESILEPQAKVVEGFAPAMPTFAGKLKDKDITAIISYIKTLK